MTHDADIRADSFTIPAQPAIRQDPTGQAPATHGPARPDPATQDPVPQDRATRGPARRDPNHTRPDPNPASLDPNLTRRDPNHTRPDPNSVMLDSNPARRDLNPARPNSDHTRRDPNPARPDPNLARRDPISVRLDPNPARQDPNSARLDSNPTRRDLGGYWFPMFVFGMLIIAAPLVYQPSGPSHADYDVWNPAINNASHISGLAFAPLQQFGTCASGLGDPMFVALYWFSVVMFGPLLSTLWYHRLAQRNGSTPQTGWYLLYACTSLALFVVVFPVIEWVAVHVPDQNSPSDGTMLSLDIITVTGFVAGLAIAAVAAWPCRSGTRISTRRWTISWLGVFLAISAAAAIVFLTYLQPKDSIGALLIISVGLLALSLVERSRVCAAVAILFAASALIVNVVGVERLLSLFGVRTHAWSEATSTLVTVALPAAILLTGAAIGLGRVLATSVAARNRVV